MFFIIILIFLVIHEKNNFIFNSFSAIDLVHYLLYDFQNAHNVLHMKLNMKLNFGHF